MGTDADWAKIGTGAEHTCGVRRDGSLWCWGSDETMQLGLEEIESVNVPTRVGTAFDWAKTFLGGWYTCGARTDRSLWCWGENEHGSLGLGDTEYHQFPTQVGVGLDWANLSGNGDGHTCGLRTDRSLWCWGTNWAGQLGLGDQEHRLVPTRV